MRALLPAVLALAGCRPVLGLHDYEPTDGSDENRGELAPSNEVMVDHMTSTEPEIAVNDLVTFDTDSGQISGAIVRAPGTGIISGVSYSQQEFAGAALGVFAMSSLTVNPSGVIKLTGTRAAVIVVEKSAKIAGKIDGGGGCADITQRSCGGPGGGAGERAPSLGTGCAPGQPGNTHLASGADTGGGGGGGPSAAGTGGAAGGMETAMSMNFPGGAGGPRCMTIELEPLLGGGGGGGGGKGTAPQGAAGGGGGGALQLSAFESITLTGTITMAGAGGEGGTFDPSSSNGGAGGGGGGGGSVLLEAPTLDLRGIIAANGGGGGGGSQGSTAGQPGANGTANAIPAPGGAGAGGAGAGGNGAAGSSDAVAAAATVTANSGGGGGGAGRVFLRAAMTPNLDAAMVSPAPGVGQIRTR